MTKNANADAAEHRRAVLVLHDEDLQAIRSDPDRVDLIDDPETRVIGFSDPGDSRLVAMLRNQGLLRPGALLVQSPYDPDRYVPAEAASTEFTVEKFLTLTELAMKLGAKRIKFVRATAEQTNSSASSDTDARHPVASAETKLSLALTEAVAQRLEGEHKFAGGEANIDSARRLLETKRLTGDPQFSNLVELRSGPNPVVRQQIKFSGTREAGINVSVAVRVAGGAGKLKLAGFGSNFSSSNQHTAQLDVETIIEF